MLNTTALLLGSGSALPGPTMRLLVVGKEVGRGNAHFHPLPRVNEKVGGLLNAHLHSVEMARDVRVSHVRHRVPQRLVGRKVHRTRLHFDDTVTEDGRCAVRLIHHHSPVREDKGILVVNETIHESLRFHRVLGEHGAVGEHQNDVGGVGAHGVDELANLAHRKGVVHDTDKLTLDGVASMEWPTPLHGNDRVLPKTREVVTHGNAQLAMQLRVLLARARAKDESVVHGDGREKEREREEKERRMRGEEGEGKRRREKEKKIRVNYFLFYFHFFNGFKIWNLNKKYR